MPIEAQSVDEAIFAIREEFTHSSPRMAAAIHNLRELCAEHATFALKNRKELEVAAKSLANQATQIKAQTTELINAGNRLQELKLEVAQLGSHLKLERGVIATQSGEIARLAAVIEDDRVSRTDMHLALSNGDSAIAKLRDDLSAANAILAQTATAFAVCNEARITEAQKHIEYVERTSWEIAQAERNLERIEGYRKTVRQLTDENIELHGKVEQKWVWRKPVSLATSIRAKLIRRGEMKATGETA